MIWLAKTVNDRLSVVETLRFQTVKKRFACVSVDMKNAVTTVVPLLELFSVRALVFSYVAFVFLLFISYLSFLCLGKDMLRDYELSMYLHLIHFNTSFTSNSVNLVK